MRKMFRKFPSDSIEYVILHAMWRVSRGKEPTSAFEEERNPRKALRLALEAAERNPGRYGWIDDLAARSQSGEGSGDNDDWDDFDYPDGDS